MEQDKYISLADSYIEMNGNEKEVAQFRNAIQHGKIKLVLST